MKTKKDFSVMTREDMLIAFRNEETLNDLLDKGILPKADEKGLWDRNRVLHSIADKKIPFYDVTCGEEVWIWNFDLPNAQLTDEEVKAKIF